MRTFHVDKNDLANCPQLPSYSEAQASASKQLPTTLTTTEGYGNQKAVLLTEELEDVSIVVADREHAALH